MSNVWQLLQACRRLKFFPVVCVFLFACIQTIHAQMTYSEATNYAQTYLTQYGYTWDAVSNSVRHYDGTYRPRENAYYAKVLLETGRGEADILGRAELALGSVFNNQFTNAADPTTYGLFKTTSTDTSLSQVNLVLHDFTERTLLEIRQTSQFTNLNTSLQTRFDSNTLNGANWTDTYRNPGWKISNQDLNEVYIKIIAGQTYSNSALLNAGLTQWQTTYASNSANGGMVEWWNGGMVEWWNGGMVEWWNGGI